MQELELLNTRLDALIRHYSALKAENKRLRGTVQAQATTIEQLNGQLGRLEEQMLGLQLDKTVLAPEEHALLRRRLDTVIGEIDKILTSLND